MPSGITESALAHAHGGEPAELDREDNHHDHAEPVMRHADADDRDPGRGAIEQAALGIAGDEAEHQPEAEAQERGGDRKHQRVRYGDHDLTGDAFAGCDRRPEIAGHRPAKPDAVLHRQRPVIAIVVLEPLDHLRRRIGRRDRADGVARRQMHE
jgi:hypothetical protein